MHVREDMANALRPISRRVNLAVWMSVVTGPLILLTGAFATVMLALKIFWPPAAPYTPFFLLAGPLILLYGFFHGRARRRFFVPGEIAEVADHLYRDDGSVTAFFEQPQLCSEPDFFRGVRTELAARLPRLDFIHYLKRFGPVLLFAAVAVAVPPRKPALAARSEQVLASLTRPLAETITELEEILPQKDIEELRADIEQIQQSKDGISREKWEAIEDVEQRLNDAVERSRNSVAGVSSIVNQIAEQQAAKGGSGGLNPDADLQGLLKDLSNAMNTPNLSLPSGVRNDLQGLLEGMNGAGLSADGLQQGLGDLQSELQDLMNQLGEGSGGQGEGMGEGPGDGQGGEGPGRGGVSRGRGDAAMAYGDPDALERAAYKEDQLRNRYLSPEDMVDLGITPLRPEPDPGKFSPGAVRSFGKREGAEVSRTRISPGQKNVVEKYFTGGGTGN